MIQRIHSAFTGDYPEIRNPVAKLCERFPGSYWRELDRERRYPTEFVAALTESGYLSILIPEAYGGAGLPLSAACAVLEEIQRAGANGGACSACPAGAYKAISGVVQEC